MFGFSSGKRLLDLSRDLSLIVFPVTDLSLETLECRKYFFFWKSFFHKLHPDITFSYPSDYKCPHPE